MDVSNVLIRELSSREWRRFEAHHCLPADAIDPASRPQVLAKFNIHFYEYEEDEAHPEPSEPPVVTVLLNEASPSPASPAGGKRSSPDQKQPALAGQEEHQLAETTRSVTSKVQEERQQATHLPSIKGCRLCLPRTVLQSARCGSSE
ncbi:uncharacterized protein LOC126577626 [Anopheles aquasalis]|uniref:uncharacterized protein LOC126577626 n=1 Tax=Anopheles aquasalis TaxID=42839 RepID=UPI00215A9D4F|nr:uncharacterized protein LOC126577626 [Anopheles aquasalis]